MENNKVEQLDLFEFDKPVIKGYPELRWTGKRPYTSTQFYPAQLKETYGESDATGWLNKIFWGDNLQVMSHLLKEYRGKINLIYIDPPFDSKADYKKKIKLKGKEVANDSNAFEEKQYGDIWTNDEYLQFMYERFILLRELLSDNGTIFIHCDWHKSHHIRCLLDDVFGPENYRNEIIWQKTLSRKTQSGQFGNMHDTILFYSKSSETTFNTIYEERDKETTEKRFPYVDEKTGKRYVLDNFTQAGQGQPRYFGEEYGVLFPPAGKHWIWSQERIEEGLKKGLIRFTSGRMPRLVRYETEGLFAGDIWTSPDLMLHSQSSEDIGYPTQKPEKLIERIIKASSNPGDLVFDCFMGSGTTQAVSMKLGRKFIGADINLGSVQIVTKRLLKIMKESDDGSLLTDKTTGFEVYNVNNYDFFRNPIEARDLLIEALGIQKFASSNVFDGELDGRHVKILPVNRIATKADLNELVANLPYKAYDKSKDENPNDPVDRITLVCMGHEPDLKASLQQMVGIYKLDIEVVDILRDKKDLEFKRDSQAEAVLKHDKVIIKNFYPMNLLQKLSLQKENVDEWRQLVDSIMVDYNYDGNILNPQIIDIPEKNDLVKGEYKIPSDHGIVRVKITDLLSESLEFEVK